MVPTTDFRLSVSGLADAMNRTTQITVSLINNTNIMCFIVNQSEGQQACHMKPVACLVLSDMYDCLIAILFLTKSQLKAFDVWLL